MVYFYIWYTVRYTVTILNIFYINENVNNINSLLFVIAKLKYFY